MAGGRKLEFDKQAVLEAAMQVFWKKGYVGASLADLTQSMGINKPSMYSAFGNKEALFLQATEHYIAHNAKSHEGYLFESGVPLGARLKHYLMSIVSAQCETDKPRGCLITLCAAEADSGALPDDAEALISKATRYIPILLESLFSQDEEAIQVGLDKDARTHALCLATMVCGTATMSRAGVSLQDLESVIDSTLKGMGFSY